jgi:hypothetical protein
MKEYPNEQEKKESKAKKTLFRINRNEMKF